MVIKNLSCTDKENNQLHGIAAVTRQINTPNDEYNKEDDMIIYRQIIRDCGYSQLED